MAAKKENPIYKLDFPKDQWEEAAALESGTIVRDWFDEGIRILIMTGPASFNAYLGLPLDHPLAGFDYDSIHINAHGGLTFASKGDRYLPSGYYWYGLDYTHLGDKNFYTIKEETKHIFEKFPKLHENETAWTIEMIEKDLWSTIYDMKALMKLAERIAKKYGG